MSCPIGKVAVFTTGALFNFCISSQSFRMFCVMVFCFFLFGFFLSCIQVKVNSVSLKDAGGGAVKVE